MKKIEELTVQELVDLLREDRKDAVDRVLDELDEDDIDLLGELWFIASG